ncbi:MAG: PIF1 family DEAD/DEAH box helicase [Patescibacteria group bacterium]|jgi:hypothetical protein
MTQEEALMILKTGANVFLTGEPGSGKTHTINQYTNYLRARGIAPSVTASTGIAATHIGGMTIHSWSGIGIKNTFSKYDLDRITSSEYIVKRISRAKILIIDEVSMLAPDTLAKVDAVCRGIKESTEPFGGLQIILVGDFFQLPPIVNRFETVKTQPTLINNPPERFAYDSSSWKKANFMTCYLTEQHRQDDNGFFAILTAIRKNIFDSDHLKLIETRKVAHEKVHNNILKIYSHNVDVDLVNNAMLEKIVGRSEQYIMTAHGSKSLAEALKRGCLSPEILNLKVGAEVMFTKNNNKEGFVNGTLGTVIDFNQTTKLPIVRMRDGREITVDSMEWSVEEGNQVRARIIQLPLRLAWAITIHKSQGMSLDEAVMDLGAVFEFGQGYVALSRVRRLTGLHLLGWNERAFQVHPDVLIKDQEFREGSEVATAAFTELPEAELQKMHENFITAAGGGDTKSTIDEDILLHPFKIKSTKKRTRTKKYKESI